MPKCNYCFTVLLFLVTPVLNVCAYIGLLASGTDAGPISAYLTFYVILSVLLALQFFISLLDTFEQMKLDHAIERSAGAASPEKLQESSKFRAWQSSAKIGEPMRLREDMYSLMYVSMVKPEYKKYCDLVAETGVPLPSDADEPGPPLKVAVEGVEESHPSWCGKFKSFLCCRGPNKTGDVAAEDTEPGDEGVNPAINTIDSSTKRALVPGKGEEGEGGRQWSKNQLLETPKEKKQREAKQSSLLGTIVFLMATQIFSALILLSALREFDWTVRAASAPVVATRFVCGLVLHVYLQAEAVQGFNNMKYALNHPWKFDGPKLAFFAGFA